MAALVILAHPAATQAQISVGDTFPALASACADPGALPATDGKIVLVDFWASWCAPCKASFAAYQRLNSMFSSKGLVVVAVSVDRDAAAFDTFVKRQSPQFFVFRDRDQGLVNRVRVPTMPTSYLLDRRHTVRYMHAGFYGSETETAIKKEIEALLAEHVP